MNMLLESKGVLEGSQELCDAVYAFLFNLFKSGDYEKYKNLTVNKILKRLTATKQKQLEAFYRVAETWKIEHSVVRVKKKDLWKKNYIWFL